VGVLVVRVVGDDVDSCSDWLFQLGATAIEERLAGDEPALVAGFDDDDTALAARSVLLERWPCRLESTGDEAEWRDEWLRWIEPVEVAGFIVHAPWHDPARWRADAETISIDPGRAFGSGHHATTQLALEALRCHVRRTDRVLDVGCGTGILSIAAAKLGAASVTGIDLDYDLLSQATANLEANGVAERVTLSNDPIATLEALDARFDVVVANIVVGDLRPLMPMLVGLAERVVVVSGFLDEQLDRVIDEVDVKIIDRTSRAGWGCAVIAPVF
jgi:ribosomal protein L11 methyltransferase